MLSLAVNSCKDGVIPVREYEETPDGYWFGQSEEFRPIGINEYSYFESDGVESTSTFVKENDNILIWNKTWNDTNGERSWSLTLSKSEKTFDDLPFVVIDL